MASDAGWNLSSDASCVFTNAGSFNNTDARLGPLADNGGPTLIVALLPGSPAIDACADNAVAAIDQRGVPRPFDAASDIGAYEYATLLRISQASANGLNIQLRDGYPGQNCRLLIGTTLSNWVSVATNRSAQTERFCSRTNSTLPSASGFTEWHCRGSQRNVKARHTTLPSRVVPHVFRAMSPDAIPKRRHAVQPRMAIRPQSRWPLSTESQLPQPVESSSSGICHQNADVVRADHRWIGIDIPNSSGPQRRGPFQQGVAVVLRPGE